MTSDLCAQLHSFAEGTLSPEQERAFGDHLADCARCQAALTGLFQLEQLGQHHVRVHGPVKVPWYLVSQHRWRALGGLSVLALAALLLVIMRPHTPPPPVRQRWVPDPKAARVLEARVTYPDADIYRPLAPTLMGSQKTFKSAEYSALLPAALEQQGDLQQLVAVYLSAGEPHPTEAYTILERMKSEARWQASDVLSDLGVAYYTADKNWEALDLFNEVLRREPTHVQALWNRALVYRKVGLPLLAREGFEAIERADKDEGWRKAAHEESLRLEDVLHRQRRWMDAEKAGEALIRGDANAIDGALDFSSMPAMRRDFYDAVRTRASAQELRALQKLAHSLDGQAGGKRVLEPFLERLTSRNLTPRRAWARRYADLVTRQAGPEEFSALLPGVLASEESDIALGVLVRTRGQYPELLAELIRRAKKSDDPWFQVLALQLQADDDMVADRYEHAQTVLEKALDLCLKERLTYRCIDLENELSHVSAWLFHVEASAVYARKGLQMARQNTQWDKEGVLLQALGNAERVAAKVTQGRAYFGEALLAAGNDAQSRLNIHQNLAHLAIQDLKLEEARRELDQAMDTGRPLTIHGAEALVDVARTRPSPRDGEALEESLSHGARATVGQRAYLAFLQGRFTVERDPSRGRQLLEGSISEARTADPEDITAKHAQTYSYTSLIFADAKQGEFASALRRFGDELKFEVPDKCVLGLTADTERSLFVARGSDGRLLWDYQPARQQLLPPDDLSGIVPRAIVEALKPCPSVDVMARPTLQGRAGVLPGDIAWGYRTRQGPPRPSIRHALHLVVNNVTYDDPQEASLRWDPHPASDAQVEYLQGLNATPSRVLEAMEKATEIDLATHGHNSPEADTPYLLLAREGNSSDRLDEERIRKAQLLGAPLVILAACEAARATSALHEPKSLPNAFLVAKARGVLAATQPIPDEDSSRFFGEVRERVRDGVPIQIAVRDVRMKWMSEEKKGANWLNGILVFE